MSLIALCLTFMQVLAFSSALTPDGTLLLSFKYSILSDPLSVLDDWAYSDPTPCTWAGVTCESPNSARVVSLALPHSKLIGSLPEDIGLIEKLHTLDLSDNSLNGSLPGLLFNHSELKTLSLADNIFSGELPEIPAGGVSLQVLNLSNNALAGKLPEHLPKSKNLTLISLKDNHFSGLVPNDFNFVKILDLSWNSLNGTLPIDFGGEKLDVLDLSHNNLSGSISSKFASKIPTNSSIDLSSNNLSGEIPPELANRKNDSFINNLDLCGNPLKVICTIASSISIPPNITNSTPAIAAIPRSFDDNNSTESGPNGVRKNTNGIKTGTILGIVVGDIAGILLLGMIVMYVYKLRKLKNRGEKTEKSGEMNNVNKEEKDYGMWGCIGANCGDSTENVSSNGSDNDENSNVLVAKEVDRAIEQGKQGKENKKSILVMVDGETKLEPETLLKASAYILGSTESSIVYKAVIQDGMAFAVRRIGEGGIERLRDFEGQVRALAKLRHPNLVRIRGFYWGDDEKLVICDYISNGSLASSAGYQRMGSASTHFSFELRLKIARGLARGLTYIHEKKQVHGNIKPSNILLTQEMEAVISDLGLNRLLSLSESSNASRDNMHNLQININSLYTSRASIVGRTSAYLAPESFENTKTTQKMDVYSFGIVFLELLTGKIFSDRELGQCADGLVAEDTCQVLKMADEAIRADLVGRVDTLLACLKLGLSCTSSAPFKRPPMKEVLQVIEKVPC